jgi:hypothetical protein
VKEYEYDKDVYAEILARAAARKTRVKRGTKKEEKESGLVASQEVDKIQGAPDKKGS